MKASPIAVFALCSLSTPLAAGTWSFEHSVIDPDPQASYRMNDMWLADINGDGLLDVWVTGRGGGTGTHQMAWYKNPSWNRYMIAPGDYKYGDTGDIDGDGTVDLVAGADHDDTVYWFENTGSPQQSGWPQHDTGIGGNPDQFHLGDIDGDGALDLVYKYKTSMGWAWPPEDPTEPWTQRTIWSSDTRTGGALSDLDRDGDLDILYGNGWFENPRPGGDPKTDSWTMHSIDASWPSEARGAVADLNGDGRPDVVLSDEEGSGGVAWYEGPVDPGGGKWIQHLIHDDYDGVHSLAVADFDKDGALDVFAAEMHTGGQRRVAVFRSADIDLNLWEEHVIDFTGSHNARVGDLDGDTWPDVCGKNFEAGELPLRVDLWTNRVAAPFRLDAWERFVIDENAKGNPVFVGAGDVDCDGRPDIISGESWYAHPGTLDGPWGRNPLHALVKNCAATADFDRDGDPDVLATAETAGDAFLWIENDGTGAFTAHINVPSGVGTLIQGARVAQIVPGGGVEIVLSFNDAVSTQMFRVPEDPVDNWSWEVLDAASQGEQIAVQDFDGDGDLDVHLGTSWLRRESNGDWTPFAAVDFADPDADPDRVETADVDGDGDWDVVIGCEHAERLVWGENPSDPTDPWPEHVIATDLLYMSLDVKDLDRDGDPDVVAGEHMGSGRVVLFENLSTGGAWEAHEVDAGDLGGLDHHMGTRLADMDGDGDFDLLSIGWDSRTLVLYENEAARDDTAESLPSLPKAPAALLQLLPCAPNPARSVFEVRYGLERAADLTIELFDVAGRRLFSRRFPETAAGWNSTTFDASSVGGRPLSGGIYYVRVSALDARRIDRVVVLRE